MVQSGAVARNRYPAPCFASQAKPTKKWKAKTCAGTADAGAVLGSLTAGPVRVSMQQAVRLFQTVIEHERFIREQSDGGSFGH